LRFDEARARYVVKLFGYGRLLRMYVIYPGQSELDIPNRKPPSGAAFLSVNNEAGYPLQSFKLALDADT